MFRHYWPQEDTCDKCSNTGTGAMLYMGNEPVSFVCEDCDPDARSTALTFANNVSDEIELNGWEWYIPDNNDYHETLVF